MEGEMKGKVCVTGGTGFLASWLIHRLLQHGYSVNTTLRPFPEGKRDVSYLTDLPGASERLQIFTAQLDKPESFNAAIEGCFGVFHVAHPMDFDGQESEEENTKKAVQGTLGILQACLDSKTVKRVVYTSSAATVMYNDKGQDIVNESSWSNIELIRRLDDFMSVYAITKTLTEKACLEFAETRGLDLVTVVPTWIHGPFVCPSIPGSVKASMALFFGNTERYKDQISIPFVHTDDVAEAHIFLFEHPDAKGRYICSALEIEVEKLYEFLSTRYPHLHLPHPTSSGESAKMKFPRVSSKKLLDSGFTFKYGLAEMFDDAIHCCKQREGKRDVRYLTDQPGASERLQIFTAELDKPESFKAAIEGCVGVFHMAHPKDLGGQESEEEKTKKAVQGSLGILQACLDSKTVKRVVYTSSIATVIFNDKGQNIADESLWSDIDLIRRLGNFLSVYAITKTLTEKACLEFAETHGLDLVTMVPSYIHGPFVCPNIPSSMKRSMAVFFGDTERFKGNASIPFVHVDDVVEAHIFLFEHPDAKGRYICSALEIGAEKLYKFLSTRYPDLHLAHPAPPGESPKMKFSQLSSKKLLDIGFVFKYGLAEMYDDAIHCCKQRGLM